MIGYEGFAKTASSLLGLKLNPRQLEAFEWYASELVEWDRRFNLTAVTDLHGIEVKHFLDSLTCLQGMGPGPAGRMIDVGTGAGFPGLPLKIVFPRLELTLVESIGKKVEFCRHVVRSLRLEGVEIVHDRVERIGHQSEHRGVYDWALARAVASMPVLVEYILPLLKLGGRGIIQKGDMGPAEAHTAEGALRILGGRVDQLIPIELPTVVECRYLVVVVKNAATPDKYPRRPGIPGKRPLK